MAAYDLNTVVPLTLTWRDSTGQKADGGSVSFVVTKPDGTTTTSATPTHGTTGVYTASGPADQVGRYVVTWTVTGANAGTYVEVYDVADYSTVLIVSVNEALSALNLDTTADPSSYQSELRGYVAAITAVVESIVGSIIGTTYTEWHDGGSQTIMLDHVPVLSISSVVETYGAGVVRTLTQQDPDVATDAYGYSADLETGQLVRRVTGIASSFAYGRKNIKVVYKAGRASVPANVRSGALELIRINWQPQSAGNRPGWSGDAEQFAVDGSMRLGFFVPNRVMQQLNPSVVDWGIA